MKTIARVPKSATRPKSTITVTLFRGARSNRPAAAEDLTWRELCDELTTLAEEHVTTAAKTATPEDQKKALLAWSPVRLKKGTTRAAANVEKIGALVLDVDDGTDPKRVITRLKKAGHAALLYGSPTDAPSHRKFRVVAPLTTPIPPDECAETRRRFAEACGLGPDSGVAACLNPDRLYFVGRLHGTPPRGVWRVAGKPVDPDRLPPTRLAWGAAKVRSVDLAPVADLPPANAGIVAALGDWTLHQGRKWLLLGGLGGAMRQAGFSRGQCEAVIRDWLPEGEPTVNVAAGVERACAAWAKEMDEVAGETLLAEHVGPEHAAVIEKAVDKLSPLRRAIRRAAKRWPERRAAKGVPVANDNDDGDPFARVQSIAKSKDEPVDYFCEELCLAPSDGKISLIGGLPSAGKGPLADYLALCFALELAAFGQWPCRKSRVLLLDAEGARLTKRRIQRMTRGLGRKPKDVTDLLVLDVSSVAVPSEGFLESLQAYVEREEITVVILDSYTSAMLATDLDSNKPEFAKLARGLGQLGAEGVLVIAVAHGKKIPADQRPTLADIAGSGALGAMAATGISVWHPDADDTDRVRVACMRAPEKPFPAFDVIFEDTLNGAGLSLRLEDGADRARAAGEEQRAEWAEVAGRILSWMQKSPMHPHTEKSLRTAAARPGAKTARPALVQAVLSALVEADLVEHTPSSDGRSNGVYWPIGEVTRVVFDEHGGCCAVDRT